MEENMTEELHQTAPSPGPAPMPAPDSTPEPMSAPPTAGDESKVAAEAAGPIGLDVGTANVVISRNGASGGTDTKLLQNAFYTIPYSRLTQKTLVKDDTPFFRKDGKLYILGDAAEDFANMFGGDTRRPIESGIIMPREDEGVDVIKAIVNELIDVPHKPGEKICCSVPGEPLD
ncbi:MAG: hypothetical protein GY859_16210, partial [Desulfobacterales bacterium]|nr:hypothetical protein [Desulfobacterales bacterium]